MARRPPETRCAQSSAANARHDVPLWRIPLVTQAGMYLAAVPLGIARRALDEFAAIVTTKTRGPSASSIGHDAAAQYQFARSEGELAAARSFLSDSIAEIRAAACRGDQPNLQQRARLLLAASAATRVVISAVDRVSRLAGAEAVFEHHPLERCFRDIHTAGQRILFSASRDQSYAKVRLDIKAAHVHDLTPRPNTRTTQPPLRPVAAAVTIAASLATLPAQAGGQSLRHRYTPLA